MKKRWNLFEIILLTGSVLAIVCCFIFSNDKNYISLATSVLGVVTVVLTSKGIVFAPILSSIYSVIYIIISIGQRYFGEAIIYAVLMLPMQIISILSWFKHKKKENATVTVNKINKKEYIIISLVAIALTIGFYFLLRVLNTEQLVVSTVSLITSILATYLLLRRCSNYAIFYILNDIILIILWTIALIKNGLSLLPMVISFYVFLINDVYGFIRWKKQEKATCSTQNS